MKELADIIKTAFETLSPGMITGLVFLYGSVLIISSIVSLYKTYTSDRPIRSIENTVIKLNENITTLNSKINKLSDLISR